MLKVPLVFDIYVEDDETATRRRKSSTSCGARLFL